MRRLHHEMRTGLGQILGYSEMLQEEAEDREQDDLLPDLEKIQKSARKLLEMAEQFYLPLWNGGGGHARRVLHDIGTGLRPRQVDDFSSTAERERFRSLPPIRQEDILDVDWTEIDHLFED